MSTRTAPTHPSPRGRKPFMTAVAIGAVAVFVGGAIIWNTRGPSLEPPTVAVGNLSASARATLEAERAKVAAKPESGAAWGAYGMALRTLDRPQAALECFRTAEKLDPQNPRWPYFIALLTEVENPSESLVKLKRSVDLAGNEPEAPRYRLAKSFLEQGEFAEADREAAALLQAHPEFLPARLIRGQAALGVNKLDEALEHARACVEDPRTRKAAWTLLTTSLRRSGALEGAAAAAEQASRAPQDKPIFDAFQAEAGTFRGDPRILSDQVHPLLAAGKLDEAAPLVERLIQEHPDFPETWMVRGRFFFLRRQFSEAEAALEKHLELEPKSTHGYFQLGMVHLTANDLTNAVQTFRRATELKPDFGPAWFNLGLAHGRARNFPESIRAFREAIRHNPEHIESYLLLADIYRRQGEIEEARALLLQAKAVDASDKRIHPLLNQLPLR